MPIKASSLFSLPFLNVPIHVLGRPLLGNDVPLFQRKLGNHAQFAIRIELLYGSRERRERSCICINSSLPSQKMFRHANALPGGYWRAVSHGLAHYICQYSWSFWFMWWMLQETCGGGVVVWVAGKLSSLSWQTLNGQTRLRKLFQHVDMR